MQAETQAILLFIGRLLLGGLFVVGGIRHLFDLPAITQAIAARRIPAAKLALLSGTAFQIVAGLALIFDFYPTWAALGLVAFTVAASVLLLNFWSMDGPARDNAVNAWQSNLAIIGGLLVTAAHSL
ncbi:MAG: DoxX family protein [Planctomycetota bacterium]|nr:MAG: DoxX family protein [Planctomycetota bacterium]